MLLKRQYSLIAKAHRYQAEHKEIEAQPHQVVEERRELEP